MPRYVPIRFWRDDVAKRRALDRLLALRRQMRAEVGPHRGDDSLLLATWNIRDFDSNKFGHGPRLPESFHYIAEVVSWFDLVAVQEVNRDLAALHKVMSLLGSDWDYLVTDTTEGSGGNEERIAFVFDRRHFGRLRMMIDALNDLVVAPKPSHLPEPMTEEHAERPW